MTGYGIIVGEAIARHSRIDKVTFTGPALTGKKIMQAAGETSLKKVTLELGSKSANIIFNDADLDEAVKWTSSALLSVLFFANLDAGLICFLCCSSNNGQKCIAGSRIFVQSGIYDNFLAKLTESAKAIKLGDPFDIDTAQGPLVSQAQFDVRLSRIGIKNIP